MPASHSPLAAAQEPANCNNEKVAAHCAYRLISQLLQHNPTQSLSPRGNLASPETERAAHPVRIGGYLVSEQP